MFPFCVDSCHFDFEITTLYYQSYHDLGTGKKKQLLHPTYSVEIFYSKGLYVNI